MWLMAVRPTGVPFGYAMVRESHFSGLAPRGAKTANAACPRGCYAKAALVSGGLHRNIQILRSLKYCGKNAQQSPLPRNYYKTYVLFMQAIFHKPLSIKIQGFSAIY